MTILEKFDAEPRFKRLARRKDNFRLMAEHCLNFAKTHDMCEILETGSAWDLDNWEWQGQSTLIWDWICVKTRETFEPPVNCLSLDITPKSIENSQNQTEYVKYSLGDSVATINGLSQSFFKYVGLLYLDSYDWTQEKNMEAAYHHMAELTACWRLLPSGCMIVVDDRHGDYKGKHWMVELFLSEILGLKPVFRNHQIGWIKP